MSVDTYTGPGEFMTITPAKDDWAKVERHVTRYLTAVGLAGRTGGRWLDCACGSGYGSHIVGLACPDSYLGIDQNDSAISQASRSYGLMSGRWSAGPWMSASAGPGMPTFLHMKIEDVREWWLDFGLYDVVLSLETIEHLTPAVQDTWVEAVAGGLTDDGVFILACPIGNDGPSTYNRYHLHEPSLEGLNALLSRHFKSVEIETEPYVDTGGRDAVQAFAVCR